MEETLRAEQNRLLRRLKAREGPGLHKMSEITSHIFISAWPLSENWEQLREHGIRAILTVESTGKEEKVLKRYKTMHVAHKQIWLTEEPRAPLLKVLDEGYDFIHGYVAQQQSVLVHCDQGVSRSVAMVAAYYLRRLYTISFKRNAEITSHIVDGETFLLGMVLSKVQEARPCAIPNAGFVMQLLVYELRLKRPYREELQREMETYLRKKRREKAEELGEEIDLYHEELQMTLDEYISEIFNEPRTEEVEEPEIPSDSLTELSELAERLRR